MVACFRFFSILVFTILVGCGPSLHEHFTHTAAVPNYSLHLINDSAQWSMTVPGDVVILQKPRALRRELKRFGFRLKTLRQLDNLAVAGYTRQEPFYAFVLYIADSLVQWRDSTDVGRYPRALDNGFATAFALPLPGRFRRVRRNLARCFTYTSPSREPLRRMKFSLFISILLPLSAFAQLYNGATLPFFECEDQWVYFKQSSEDSSYHYGFVFLDEQAGFILNHEGEFRVLPSGRWEALPSNPVAETKIRLSATTLRVALMSTDKRLDLNLPPEPDWLELYKFDTGSVRSLIRRGFHYNHVGASHRALVELLKANEVDPDAFGLAYELAYAHNHLENYAKAIEVIERSIRRNGNDGMLYRELAYALVGLGKLGQAEISSRAGIEVCTDHENRAEIAVHMAGAWYNAGNEAKFREWAQIVRQYAQSDSPFIEHIANYESELEGR